MASGSEWNLWVWLLGVVVRRYIYIDFLILLIPTPLVSVLFYSSIPTFCSLFLNIDTSALISPEELASLAIIQLCRLLSQRCDNITLPCADSYHSICVTPYSHNYIDSRSCILSLLDSI